MKGHAFEDIMTELVAHLSMLRQLGFESNQMEHGISMHPLQEGQILVIVVANGKKFTTCIGIWGGDPKEFTSRCEETIKALNSAQEVQGQFQARIDRSRTLQSYDSIVAKLQLAGVLGT